MWANDAALFTPQKKEQNWHLNICISSYLYFNLWSLRCYALMLALLLLLVFFFSASQEAKGGDTVFTRLEILSLTLMSVGRFYLLFIKFWITALFILCVCIFSLVSACEMAVSTVNDYEVDEDDTFFEAKFCICLNLSWKKINNAKCIMIYYILLYTQWIGIIKNVKAQKSL